ncbi:hypothetical protein GYMLUDRAFT_1026213 [Collybiopsis luxurians FD-317 M1]|uniref:Cytochrome P450 n=1 Tax=Collybiopsis luxurians FD-317 M1 TaxID=944289 RepID=A0A0D0CEU3_9AGAR|nr:hypothetical protein GYMLUDRAFT_1026213 [Collybiopsis luxurians FD-317 M1]
MQWYAKLPPGPRRILPFLGLYDFPASGDPLPWVSHFPLYGSISSVTVLGRTVVLLNDLTTCTELLNKRSAIYSGRPVFPFAGDMIGWDQQLIMAQCNSHFYTMRRLLKTHIGTPKAAAEFQYVQERETRNLLRRLLLDHPDNVQRNIRLVAGAIALSISHGYSVHRDGPDPFISLVEKAAREFYQATLPGAWMVDTFPFLRHIPDWVPWVTFKKIAAQYRADNFEQSNAPFDYVKNTMAVGTAVPSFLANVLKSGVNSDAEYSAKFAATAIYGGGSDPVVAALSTFMLLMALNPEVQAKAQDEIDSVVGPDELPSFKHKDDLIYINAMVKEVFRWHSTGRIGIPHRVIQDDYYDGYLIPKDSIIIPHIWNITRDSKIYHNPDQFCPERFLDENGHIPELDPCTFFFGFGRRICPGEDLAKAHMFITIAMILATFSIQKPSNKTGNKVQSVVEFEGGTVCHPKPFDITIEPRTEQARVLIESMVL